MNKVYISNSEQEKKEVPSKTINEIRFTEKAMMVLSEEYKMKLDELTDKELKDLLNKAEHDEKIIAADSGDVVWTKEDMECICVRFDEDCFYKIEELKLYTSKYPSVKGNYNIFGQFGDTSKFLRNYLMIIDYQDEKSCNRIFERNLRCIFWNDEDNEIKEAVEKQLEKIKNDILEDEVLILQGKTPDSLEKQIEIFAGSKEEYKFMGLAYGKQVYRIKDKIYYINWYIKDDEGFYCMLQEFGRKGYEYFGNR